MNFEKHILGRHVYPLNMILRYNLKSVSKPTTLVSVSTVNPHSSNNKHLREKAYRPQSDKMQRLDPKTSTDLIETFLSWQ
jgi:hypothetical protein